MQYNLNTMTEAILFDCESGEAKTIKPENGRDFNLQELYKLLKCDTIQVVCAYIGEPGSPIIICDEEGLFNNKAANKPAFDHLTSMGSDFFHFVGNVILCPSEMLK